MTEPTRGEERATSASAPARPVPGLSPRQARDARSASARARLAARLGVTQDVVDQHSERAAVLAEPLTRRFLLDAIAQVHDELARVQAAKADLYQQALELGMRRDERAGTSSPAFEVRSITSEIATRTLTSERSVAGELGRATAIVASFPAVHAALAGGRISLAHANVLCEAATKVTHPDESECTRLRESLTTQAITRAERATPARLKTFATRLAERLTASTLDERFERARLSRGVWLTDIGDGMGELTARASYVLLAGIHRRLTAQARTIHDTSAREQREARAALRREAHIQSLPGQPKRRTLDDGGRIHGPEPRDGDLAASIDYVNGRMRTAEHRAEPKPPGTETVTAGVGPATEGLDGLDHSEDTRTIDAIRADILTDIALTSDPLACPDLPHIDASVAVVIPVLTLLDRRHPGAEEGAHRDPAILDGVTPVPLSEAKRLAATAPTFVRMLTDPITGTLVETDTYRPTASMRRWLDARDGTCRFPGCLVPAARCDIDHTRDHQHGGPTALVNLANLCERHHSGKQFTAWQVKQLPGGVLEWRSPTGELITETPRAPGVTFRPSKPEPEPPPF